MRNLNRQMLQALLLATGFMPMVAAAQESTEAPSSEESTAESPETGDASGTPPAEASTSDDAARSAAEPQSEEPLVTIPVEPVTPEPATAAAPERSREPEATTLEDITVTSTKRVEPLRKLESSVGHIEGEDLEAISARQLEDYLSYIPGITLQPTNAMFQSIAVRGVGPQSQGLAANGTVGILINEVPMSDPVSIGVPVDLEPYDLQGFEVLKGPQGTLFGAAALGGAIRYVLQKPQLGLWETRGFVDQLSIGEGGTGMTYGTVVNAPIGNELAFRGVMVSQDVPGLYDHINESEGTHIPDADSGEKLAWRVLGTYQPSERISLDAVYLSQRSFKNNLTYADNDEYRFEHKNVSGPSTFEIDLTMANLDARYHFDWATLVSSTSRLSKLAIMDLVLPAGPAGTTGSDPLRNYFRLGKSYSTVQELRLQSPDDSDSPWAWTGGLYYYRHKGQSAFDLHAGETGTPAAALFAASNALGVTGITTDQLPPLQPSERGVSAIYLSNNPNIGTEKSVFAELSRKFFDDFKLTLGGRYYDEHLQRHQILGGALVAQVLLYEGNGSGAFLDDKVTDASGFNPKVSASWQVTDDVFWYATAARGFQFGGNNNPPVLPTSALRYPFSYKPSTLWSYETGVRTDWLDRTFQLDFTPYLLLWKDLQLEQNTGEQAASSTYTANVGRARAMGAETSTRWLLPIPGLIFGASATYTRAEVREAFRLQDNTFIPVGHDLPQQPHIQYTSTLSYNTYLGVFKTGGALTWQRQGPAWNDLRHGFKIYDYETLAFNWNLGFPEVWLAPEIALNVTNALDEDAFLSGGVGTCNSECAEEQGANSAAGTFLRPRAMSLRVSGRF